VETSSSGVRMLDLTLLPLLSGSLLVLRLQVDASTVALRTAFIRWTNMCCMQRLLHYALKHSVYEG
jgi:hypothetical protein